MEITKSLRKVGFRHHELSAEELVRHRQSAFIQTLAWNPVATGCSCLLLGAEIDFRDILQEVFKQNDTIEISRLKWHFPITSSKYFEEYLDNTEMHKSLHRDLERLNWRIPLVLERLNIGVNHRSDMYVSFILSHDQDKIFENFSRTLIHLQPETYYQYELGRVLEDIDYVPVGTIYLTPTTFLV